MKKKLDKIENCREVFFVTGIDTGIGKTIVTGLMARSFGMRGINVITQKMVQTGCVGISDDIVAHRQLMGKELLDIDKDGSTCPYIFETPCSPDLAARLEKRRINCKLIKQTTLTLMKKFDVVLLEGAGGLSVPLTENSTILDYVEEQRYPLVLVTSPRLGSINHTLNALEIIKGRQITLAAVVYNLAEVIDVRIARDTREVISSYLKKYNFNCPVIDIDVLETHQKNNDFPDFSSILMARSN